MTLRSGDRALIRPVRANDKQRLLDVFERLSAKSRHRRFFAAAPRLRAGRLRFLTEVDHHPHEALAAVPPHDRRLGTPGQRAAALARRRARDQPRPHLVELLMPAA